jgi:hypothetical protein
MSRYIVCVRDYVSPHVRAPHSTAKRVKTWCARRRTKQEETYRDHVHLDVVQRTGEHAPEPDRRIPELGDRLAAAAVLPFVQNFAYAAEHRSTETRRRGVTADWAKVL